MLTLLLLATGIQLLVWLIVFLPALRGGAAVHAHDRPVSVIVCFRNEAGRIGDCLRGILAQEHPDFELIAVDDHSDDGSPDEVRALMEGDDRLRLVRPDFSRPGKKDALSAGVRAATHPLLLLTDADCQPSSTAWLGAMTAPLRDGETRTVLGCSPYRRAPGLLNAWQRFEATQTVLQYQGLARLGLPYMGVGRNLAYTKDFFAAAGGLTEFADLPGGDDDLLVNHHATAGGTARMVHRRAWTVSEPSTTWEEYFHRKARHQSVGFHYKLMHQLLLGGIALSHGLFYLYTLLLVISPVSDVDLGLYLLRATVVVITYLSSPVNAFAGGASGAGRLLRIPLLLLFDALYSLYYVFLLFASFSDRRSW